MYETILDILKSGDYDIIRTIDSKYGITINLRLNNILPDNKLFTSLEIDYSKYYKVIEISFFDKEMYQNTFPFFPQSFNPDFKEIYDLSYDLVKDYLLEKYRKDILKLESP